MKGDLPNLHVQQETLQIRRTTTFYFISCSAVDTTHRNVKKNLSDHTRFSTKSTFEKLRYQSYSNSNAVKIFNYEKQFKYSWKLSQRKRAKVRNTCFLLVSVLTATLKWTTSYKLEIEYKFDFRNFEPVTFPELSIFPCLSVENSISNLYSNLKDPGVASEQLYH